MSGCKPDDDFFVFAAQFGYGLMCWGMVLGPSMNLSKSNDALKKMKQVNTEEGPKNRWAVPRFFSYRHFVCFALNLLPQIVFHGFAPSIRDGVLRASEKSTQQKPPFQRRNTYLANK
jgi:hypothetical protein